VTEYIHKGHNISILLYQLVCPAKYCRVVFTEKMDTVLQEIRLEIAMRDESLFLGIGVDKDHVHFLIQSVLIYSPTKVAKIIKSITAREVFIMVPSVKNALWGSELWTKGYFISTVGKSGYERMISEYVKEQGRAKEYRQLH